MLPVTICMKQPDHGLNASVSVKRITAQLNMLILNREELMSLLYLPWTQTSKEMNSTVFVTQ